MSRRLIINLVYAMTASLLVFSSVSGNEPVQPDYKSSIKWLSTSDPSSELFPAYAGCGGVSAPAIRSEYEQQVIDLVNRARAEQNLPPLKRANELVEAARYHANDMIMDNYFQHDSYDRDGSDLVHECDTFKRIISYYSLDWRAMAENIAAGQADPERVMRAWMNSPGHRDNILSSQTWEIGVGYATGGAYSHYWVQDFGKRAGVYPVVINYEAESTDSRTVELFIYGDWQLIRLRNDDDAWGEWQPFQSQLSWLLNSGTGEHTVWVEMRSDSRTAASNDSIILTQVSGSASLGNLPASLNFLYSIVDGKFYPPSASIIPLNTGSSEILEWTATTDGGLFKVSPGSGVTPQVITVVPDDGPPATPGTYQNTLTIAVSSPTNVLDSPQDIQLNLFVTSQPLTRFFVPLVAR